MAGLNIEQGGIRVQKGELKRIVRPVAGRFFPEGKFEWEEVSDAQAVQLTVFDPENPSRMWLKFKLRDRAHDGPDWKSSNLNTWPNMHRDDKLRRWTKGVEESTYWMDPEHSIERKRGKAYAEFVENPYEALPWEHPSERNLNEWLSHFKDVVNADQKVFPGFYSFQPLPAQVRADILSGTQNLLADQGYDYLSRVPTWFHVYMSDIKKHGFKPTHKADKLQIDELIKELKMVSPEDRAFSSWLVVLQFFNQLVEDQGGKPERYVGDKNVFRTADGKIITYPLSRERNLWVDKRLREAHSKRA